LARRIAEGLWWVMVKNEPYRYKLDHVENIESRPILVNNRLIDSATGEILKSFVED